MSSTEPEVTNESEVGTEESTQQTEEQVANEAASAEGATEEPEDEIERMKAHVRQLEEESKLNADGSASGDASAGGAKPASGPDVDSRSIYVGNVDYSTTLEELKELFSACGPVERVTIPSDKGGQPKGFAYIEFKDVDSISNASLLNETEFKGRLLKISPKRTNIPGFNRGGARGGRGGFRGGFRGGRGGHGDHHHSGYGPIRGRGRGRGRGYYPY